MAADRPKPNTIDEAVARHEKLERRVLMAQGAILRLALPAGVKVSFGEGRRATDVTLVLLAGDRDKVLALPAVIEDELEFHVHVLRSTFAREKFELMLVLMDPVEGQPLRSPERRAALRRQLSRLERNGEGAELLDTGEQEISNPG